MAAGSRSWTSAATTDYIRIPLGSAATVSSIDFDYFSSKKRMRHLRELLRELREGEAHSRLAWHVKPKQVKRAPVVMRQRYQRTFTGLRYKIGGEKR